MPIPVCSALSVRLEMKEIDAHSIMATIYRRGRKLIPEKNGEEKSMAQGD